MMNENSVVSFLFFIFSSNVHLAEVYDETGHREEVLSLARKIIDKEIKIPSSTVSVIKQKTQQLIEKSEAENVIETKSIPAPQNRTRDQR